MWRQGVRNGSPAWATLREIKHVARDDSEVMSPCSINIRMGIWIPAPTYQLGVPTNAYKPQLQSASERGGSLGLASFQPSKNKTSPA